MIQEIISKWEERKDLLQQYFKTTNQSEYSTYQAILKKVFELVLNDESEEWDYNKMTVVDDGDYQGTQLFITPMNTYQPNEDQYIITHTYYGSCSGCDTLENISEYDSELPTDEQVADYMMLSLHLVQKMQKLG